MVKLFVLVIAFIKKYFTALPNYSNGIVSTHFKWSVKIENKDTKSIIFKVENKTHGVVDNYNVDKTIFSKTNASYHNAMYDIFVTLTNLKTLGYLLK